MTVLLWIFGISLLINEFDTIGRKHKEYYWHMLTRYGMSTDTNFILKLFEYARIIIKSTLLLPLLALATLVGL